MAGTNRVFHGQAVFATAFTVLTTGVFLSGLALSMGASDLLVGYISMIVNICGVSILFFSSLMGRFRSLKRVTLLLTALSKGSTLLLVLIPILVPKGAQIAVFVPVMVLGFTLQAQTTVALNNWMVSAVGQARSGRYIARRQTFVLAVTVLLSLAGGRFLDAAGGGYFGFAALFFAAFLAAVAELLLLARIPDAEHTPAASAKGTLGGMARLLFSCRPYLRFVGYIFFFYVMISFADSFTTLYMMRYLALPYTAVTALQMLISLPQIFLLGLWGRLSDKRGNRFTLMASIWFFVGEMLFVGLADRSSAYLFLPIAFLFAAVGNAGFVVSVFNRRYELMPLENRMVYDNFFSAAVGLAFLLGPFLGGLVKGSLERAAWVMENIPFGHIRLLYAVAAAGIVLVQTAVCVKARRVE